MLSVSQTIKVKMEVVFYSSFVLKALRHTKLHKKTLIKKSGFNYYYEMIIILKCHFYQPLYFA
jgi:hypothetical protein